MFKEDYGEKKMSQTFIPASKKEAEHEAFYLKPKMRELVKEIFEKKGYEIVEFTDTHVVVLNPQKETRKYTNRSAYEFCGQG